MVFPFGDHPIVDHVDTHLHFLTSSRSSTSRLKVQRATSSDTKDTIQHMVTEDPENSTDWVEDNHQQPS